MTHALPDRADPSQAPDSYEDLSRHIRDITEQEITTFWEQGWIHVPNFVSPELCEQVIARYMNWVGLRWRDWPQDPADQRDFIATVDGILKRPRGTFGIRQDDPWMFNYVTQRKFGEAAARFLRVPSVKPLSETLHVKYPVSSGHSRKLGWHQDFPALPIDRAEATQFWLALVPITPDMGPMTHLTGSHREMPGGRLVATEDAREIYPELWERHEVSVPKPLAQGDAIFHHALTWHASGANLTDKVRWAMSSYRFSGRTRYTGAQNFNTDGLGLTPYEPFDHPNFPTVYP
jgi:hypothetical protein